MLSVVCAALIAALATALCPSGFSRKLTRAAGGLLLLAAVLKPLGQLDWDRALEGFWASQAVLVGQTQAEAQESRDLQEAIIARQTAAYISGKAAALGIRDPQVWVDCRWTGEGFPAPDAVRVRGEGDPEAWRALQSAIQADFGLDPARQTLERTDVT